MNEGENAATRSAGDDAEQTSHGQIAEVDREIGDDEVMVRLGDATGLLVVFGNGGVFVAEVELGHFFDVLVQLAETLFDMFGLGPDSPVDQAFLVIGQVHESGEALPEVMGIENGEEHPARRRDGEQSQHEIIKRADGEVAPGVLGFNQDRTPVGRGEGEHQGKRKASRPGQGQARVTRQAPGKLFHVHVHARKWRGGEKFGRGLPAIPGRGAPLGEELFCALAGGCEVVVDGPGRRLPFGFERLPVTALA